MALASRGKKESTANFPIAVVVDMVEDRGFVVVEFVDLIVVESVFLSQLQVVILV